MLDTSVFEGQLALFSTFANVLTHCGLFRDLQSLPWLFVLLLLKMHWQMQPALRAATNVTCNSLEAVCLLARRKHKHRVGQVGNSWQLLTCL